MLLRSLSLIAVAVALLAAVPAAHGQFPRSIGRYLGVGWSDGYHSRSACPPKRQALPAGQINPQPIPWWAVPANQPEPLPHPAATTDRAS